MRDQPVAPITHQEAERRTASAQASMFETTQLKYELIALGRQITPKVRLLIVPATTMKLDRIDTSRECRKWVTGCRDDASRVTDGLPSAADAPLQRSELAKSASS